MIQRFVSGLIGPPYGLNGKLKVRSLSGEKDHIVRLKQARLLISGIEKIYGIEEIGEVSGTLFVKFRGIDSPEEAKALTGAELLTDRDEAATLTDGEYYIEDLKGLRLVLAGLDGKDLGEISNVFDGGGGSIAEVSLNAGDKRLIPFRKEFFGEIDLNKGRAVLLEEWIIDEAVPSKPRGKK